MYHLTDTWFTKIFWKIFIPLVPIVNHTFTEYLHTFQPDSIISTHYLTQFILPKNYSVPMSTVITDYHPHKTWLSVNNQYLFVATEEVKEELMGINVPSIVSGIPIHPDFFKEKNKEELRKKYTITNDWPVILLLLGRHQTINSKGIITALENSKPEQQLNIIIINKRSSRFIKTRLNLISLTQTDCMDELMRVSDVVISKAGGLTITEAIYLQKPLVITDPIPGQEDYNTLYLEKNNLGKQVQSATEAAQQIQKYLSNPALTNKKSYPDASKIILTKILN